MALLHTMFANLCSPHFLFHIIFTDLVYTNSVASYSLTGYTPILLLHFTFANDVCNYDISSYGVC